METIRVLETKRDGDHEERITRDCNGFFRHEFRTHPIEQWEPNAGWHVDYMSLTCLTVSAPYPYTAPSNYYIKK
jgi:hypothetical protein